MIERVKDRYLAHVSKKSSPATTYEMYSDAKDLDACILDLLKRLDVKSTEELSNLVISESRPTGYKKVYTKNVAQIILLPSAVKDTPKEPEGEFARYRVFCYLREISTSPLVIVVTSAGGAEGAANAMAGMYNFTSYKKTFAGRVFSADDMEKPLLSWGNIDERTVKQPPSTATESPPNAFIPRRKHQFVQG